MNVETLITRALSAIDKTTRYESPGVMPAFAANSWPAAAKNDCSGFVNWCLRFSQNRKVDHPLYHKVNGGWFETSAIHADGISTVGFFTQIQQVKPGALVVYPDFVGQDGKNHDGHIGIVLEGSGSGVEGINKIIHCSFGNWKATGDAIQITDPQVWLRKSTSIIVWCEGLEE